MDNTKNKEYGKELILDIHDCDPSTFNRGGISEYFKRLCELIDMQRCNLYFWDYLGEKEEYEAAPDHLKGTSAVQFIATSNIVIHALDVLGKVFVNIFSCKEFARGPVEEFTEIWFGGKVIKSHLIERV